MLKSELKALAATINTASTEALKETIGSISASHDSDIIFAESELAALKTFSTQIRDTVKALEENLEITFNSFIAARQEILTKMKGIADE